MTKLDGIGKFRLEVADRVATVTMAAPPVNAQGRQFREEFVRVMDALGQDHEVGAIVLTGEGRAFSAGADLNERGDIAHEPGGYARHNRLVRTTFDVFGECPKPIVAAVNGAAVGAGCGFALLSDILVVAEEAWFAFTEVDHGLAGGARHVMRSFSPSDARLLIYTARRVSGAELFRMNVASACVPGAELMSVALGMAREIAAKPPAAIAAAKRSFSITEEMPLRDGYRFEQWQTAMLAGAPDFGPTPARGTDQWRAAGSAEPAEES